ncbi:MAG: hypothetical protein QOE54_5411 [Streptosporangiaceae bacterium]|jgi:hypothetical protein|nr:hypothetical protein [Streptosporangiaceae bacterium]
MKERYAAGRDDGRAALSRPACGGLRQWRYALVWCGCPGQGSGGGLMALGGFLGHQGAGQCGQVEIENA